MVPVLLMFISLSSKKKYIYYSKILGNFRKLDILII